MNSHPATSAQGWRIRLVALSVFGLWALVAARLIQVQCWQSSELTRFAARQQILEVEVPARPADIVDRNGRILATSITAQSLFVDPLHLNASPEFLVELADALDINSDSLAERLTHAEGRRFMWVKRRLTDEQVSRVQALDWPASSHGFREEFLREYPQESLAAHVLGLRDIDGKPRSGVEKSLNHLIQGQPGRRRLVRDAMGRIVEVSISADDEPRRLQSISLTIDLAIQVFVERELAAVVKEFEPKSACAIVMEPESGDILAMASRPTYSPTKPGKIPANAWQNQAINIIYEPGSTFKPMIVGWALQQDAIRRDEIFHCENGLYRMGRRQLKDHHSYGPLSVTDILVKSSNIGMAKIGERLTNERLFQACLAFGFGRPTGVDLPSERSGILRPLTKWNGYSTGSIPMGQEIAVTPLQLITAHAALANGGWLISPQLLKGVQGRRHAAVSGMLDSTEDPDLAVPSRIVTRAIDEDIAEWLVREPMVEVVKRGTGKRARLPSFTVFGKTGTAQKFDPETGAYSKTRYTSSFICGAPAEDPQVLVLVVVDEPVKNRGYYGGIVAAPTAASILNQTLLYRCVPGSAQPRTAAR